MSARTALRARFRAVGERCVRPTSDTHDCAATFDREAFRALGRAGLFDPAMDLSSQLAALWGLVEGSGDLGLATSALAQQVAIGVLRRHGSADQRAQWVARLGSGDAVAAVANAEPGAGSDILALRARARPTADGFLLTGRKRSITNVPAADLVLLSARLEGAPADRSISTFAVALPAPRAWTRTYTDLLGLRTSPTGDLLLKGAQVPAAAILGQPGEGVAVFREVFDHERLLAGALFLGTLTGCLARGLAHAARRSQFGAPIGQNQYVQGPLVEMAAQAHALEAHLFETAARAARGAPCGSRLSSVKVLGLEAATAAAQAGLRLRGGQGLRAGPAERAVRDLSALALFGGTVELHKRALWSDLQRRAPRLAWCAPPAPGSALESELVALVARALPGMPELQGKYSFDSPPTRLVLARDGACLVGFRALYEREYESEGRRIPGVGFGVAVDPPRQQQGVATALTAAACEAMRADGRRLALAFLQGEQAVPLLRSFGFERLQVPVTYTDSAGQNRAETAPAWALGLQGERPSAVVGGGSLHVGRGIW